MKSLSFRPTPRMLIAALLLCSVLGAFGVWVLLHPASIWVQPWRAEQSNAGSEVMFGPYPVEEDFRLLKQQGVTTIISLLDSNIPYEKVLLQEERERARRHGMQLLNYPMGSILGQSFGKDYLKNSKAAAQAAVASEGLAYIHCYLGLHRAVNVQKYLATMAATRTYVSARSERADDVSAQRRASTALARGDYVRSLAELRTIPDKSVRAQRVEAWTHYRLGRIDAARALFNTILQQEPGDRDALAGLAYSALFENDLASASARFERLLARDPEDVALIEGLGHVRYRQQRHDEARTLFRQALAKNPDNPETRDVLEKLGGLSAATSGSD